MEQQNLPDHGGRRIGIDRRVLLSEIPSENEQRSGEDRRNGFERRLQARFVSGAIKNLDTIKFAKPSVLGKLYIKNSRKV